MISPAKSLGQRLKFIKPLVLAYWNLLMKNACAVNWILRKIPYERQQELPIEYKGMKLNCGYRLDIVVAGSLILELKASENLRPIDAAQLLTYLKLTGIKVGLIINFNVSILKEGIRRIVN